MQFTPAEIRRCDVDATFGSAECAGNAGWSSPVARQAHNLKAAGSNPAPATNKTSPQQAGFFVGNASRS